MTDMLNHLAATIKSVRLPLNEGSSKSDTLEGVDIGFDLKLVPKFKVVPNDDGTFTCSQLRPDGEILECGQPVVIKGPAEGSEQSHKNVREAAEEFKDKAMDMLADYSDDIQEDQLGQLPEMYERLELGKELIEKHLKDDSLQPAIHDIEATFYFADALMFFGTAQMIISQHLQGTEGKTDS